MPFRRPTCLGSPDNAGEKTPLPPSKNEMQLAKIESVDEIPENERGVCVVTLHKKEGEGLGLTVSGGCDKDSIPKITNMRTSGIAATSDRLQVGDRITSVNGIRTTKMKHAEIISLLKNVGETVMFSIEYHLPPTTSRTATVIQKTTEVMLKKEDSFGFVLRGGPHEEMVKSRPHVITHIRRESVAERNGIMKTGDRILGINSTRICNMNLAEVIKILDTAEDLVHFTIEYDVSVMDAVSTASGPLLVEVSKAPGCNLGLVLAVSNQWSKHVICVEKIQPASIADRCGALHVGDRILSIDGVSLDAATVSVLDASRLLHSASDNVRLEILPASHLAVEAPKYFGVNRFVPTIASTQSLSALNYFPRYPKHQQHFFDASTLRHYGGGHSRKKAHRPKYAGSAMSLSSVDYMSGNQVVHTETLNIHLLSADDPCMPEHPSGSYFGIQLQGGVFATELLSAPPAVAFLERDSAAERSGRIQVGDRVLSVNGCRTENESLDEVNRMLWEAVEIGQVYIELEFDVAESVIPGCGTFHVKLPKRCNADLGIVIGASGKACDPEPLIIVEVKKGSAAHRTGTLQAGDKLLAIDGVRLGRSSTVEDAWALLQSAEDVVRLKIRKDDDNSDDAEHSGSISFNVELKRYHGPLGITISGTEERFDPVVISGLAPGGLAFRTGAIHEGDQILSINGVSLRTKPLSEAISLLQTAGETVNLKIRKKSDIDSPYRDEVQANNMSSVSGYDIMKETISEQSDVEDDAVCDSSPPAQSIDANRLHGNIASALGRVGPAGAPSVESSAMALKESTSVGRNEQNVKLQSRIQKNEVSPVRFGTSSPRRVESLRARFESGKESQTRTWGPRSRKGCEMHPDTRVHRPVADWQNALMDLQSVGQPSDIMRDLEESILSGSNAVGPHDVSHYRSHIVPDTLSSAGSTVQLHKITIQKADESEDCGFSLSDGQLERGVFVHSTRCGGPADRAGIKPYDRILQVNGIRTRDFDCCQAIPLIARGGKRIVLVVARHPNNSAMSIMSHHSPLLAPPVEVPNRAVMHAGPYGTL